MGESRLVNPKLSVCFLWESSFAIIVVKISALASRCLSNGTACLKGYLSSRVFVEGTSHSFTVWFELAVILGDAGALC